MSIHQADNGMGAPRRRSGIWGIVLGVGVALLLVIAGAIVAVVVQHVMYADKDESTVVAFQDWRVICPPASEKNTTCVLDLDVTRDPGQALLRLSLSDTAPNSVLSITVPHGVMLDPGLGFAVGSGAMKVRPYETCDSVGCIAGLNLDADTLNAMKAATSGQVAVVPGTGKPVSIPFSLKGFADGFAELERAKSRRAFWSFLD